ncbi:hypothetical protein ACH47Z_45395 [Streptomyces sp. NPDC020192]|uniref:hypothetical protein n=1 Tax=Streptomyces sp. NPDC020192 TaxID=3365066 RepID=UPI0037AB03B5
MVTADRSLPTVLRILSRLTHTTPRRHTPTATAVIDFVATAVAIGYDIHPDLEIPVPGPNFAEHLEIIVAATSPTCPAVPPSSAPQPTSSRTQNGPEEGLPNRPAPESPAERTPVTDAVQEPERLLVEVTAAGHEPESASTFFEEAVAVCWKTATAARTSASPDGHSSRRAYYLDRFRHHTPRARSVQALPPASSGVGVQAASASRSRAL